MPSPSKSKALRYSRAAAIASQHSAKERDISAACHDKIAVDLQHKIAAQILPQVAVLVAGVVRFFPHMLVRCAQIVGCGVFGFA